MDTLRNAAYVVAGRACGLAGVAIFFLMFAFAFDPALAARIGGGVCLLVTVILVLYALTARHRRYDHTELWGMLGKENRPPADIAQEVIGEALRESYFWYARQAALYSIALLVISIILQIADVGVWPRT